MKERMLLKGLEMLIALAMKFLTPEKLKELIDAMLDKLEDLIQESDAKWDDVVFMPIVKLIRTACDIPDND